MMIRHPQQILAKAVKVRSAADLCMSCSANFEDGHLNVLFGGLLFKAEFRSWYQSDHIIHLHVLHPRGSRFRCLKFLYKTCSGAIFCIWYLKLLCFGRDVVGGVDFMFPENPLLVRDFW